VNCEEFADLLHPFADGELDLVRSLAVERHLQGCPGCAMAIKELKALQGALTEPALYHRAPAALRDRVRASLRPARRTRAGARPLPWRFLAVAASLAFVATLTWATLLRPSLPSADERVAQQVLASHVRSLMLPGRDVDVASSDQHTVKPWFNGQVTFSPPVKKLDGAGFKLVGGRLDYLDRQKVATLVYKRGGHVISLFIWPAADRSTRLPRALTDQGYHIIPWCDGDLTYWVVSDLNEGELRDFVDLIRR
jgi:anti-sigma factor RsiW